MKPLHHLPEPAPLGEAGGRVELRLRAAAANSAGADTQGSEAQGWGAQGVVTYDARWFFGERRQEGWIEIHATPLRVEIHAGEAPLPDWLLHFTEALLRTTARSVKEGGWPRRLTRWRKP